MKNVFANKVAIITGGTSGIGYALARSCAAKGAHVVLTSRTFDSAQRVVDLIRREGLQATPYEADVRDAAALRQLVVETVSKRGRLDLLFNNAGVSVFGEVRDHLPQDWDHIIDVNLRGVINGINAAYPQMIEQRFGHIVNVASLAGLVPTPGGIAYTASKAAVVGLSQALRIEAKRYGVNVSVVCPGATSTAIIENTPYRGLDRDKFLASVPGTPQSSEACARQILRGIARNVGVITPGMAGFLWWMHRNLPFITRLILGRMSATIALNRDVVAARQLALLGTSAQPRNEQRSAEPRLATRWSLSKQLPTPSEPHRGR